MKIFDDIFGYVHPMGANCNVYAFKDNATFDLIDSGATLFGIHRWLLKEMKKDGLNPACVRNIYHTHLHPDHIQGDYIFQKLAKKQNHTVSVFIPKEDAFRNHPHYKILKYNIHHLSTVIPQFPFKTMRGTVFMTKFLFDSKFSHHIPENLKFVNDGDMVVIGTRNAKVIHTGGHTHGHSFYHLPDYPENILVNGDAWCINEFTSDFQKVMHALTVSEELKPDNLLGGHDPLHLGPDHSMKDILASRRRLDDIIRPILELSKSGRVVNATYAAHKRIKNLMFIGVVRMWAHMTVLSFCELLQNLEIGTIGCEPDGKITIKITEDPAVLTKYEELFQSASEKSISPTRILEKILGSKKD